MNRARLKKPILAIVYNRPRTGLLISSVVVYPTAVCLHLHIKEAMYPIHQAQLNSCLLPKQPPIGTHHPSWDRTTGRLAVSRVHD